MKNWVYIARSDSECLQEKLRAAGIPFAVQDGPYSPELLKGAAALVPGKLPVTAAELEAAPALRLITKFGVGLDRIDLSACTRRQITVCNSPLVNCVSVAEHALTLLMMAAKQMGYHCARMQQSPPLWRNAASPKGIELCGKTLTVIGLGHIGKTMAMLGHGLGMKIVAYDPYAEQAALPEYIRMVQTLPEAMAAGDFISLHVAGGEKTRGLIGEKELACTMPSAMLINTTRGFVVDEHALAKALDEGRIAGAAVDVLTDEPVSAACALLHRDNVIVTPHCAANTVDAHRRAEECTAENLIQAWQGLPLEYAVNGPFEKG